MLARRGSISTFISLSPLAILVLGLVLLTTLSAAPAPPQQPELPPAAQVLPPLDPVAVDRAVRQGVDYLRRAQHPDGHWGAGTGPGSDKGWAVGYTCLAGLALVECGVPASDPGLKVAASGIRHYANDLDSTYEVALAILFLDRMGEKRDTRTIQTLAARLIAGQTATGGWGYKVPKHTTVESAQLLAAIRRFSPPLPPAPPSVRERPGSMGLCIKAADDAFFRAPAPFDSVNARKQGISSLPTKMKQLPVLFDTEALILDEPKDQRSDNSNTHFAILGLWAARKHDVPADRSFRLLGQRFHTSQGKDGSWAYEYVRGGANGPAQMTCVALLGLAIGHVLNPDAAVRPEMDPKVVNAFAALSPRIGEPAGRFDNRPTIKEVGGLYFLWAMERIAVLYDVRQLDKKDWYRWGAEILIGHQAVDGSWTEDGGYHGQHPALNTAFALLFLKRANLTPDLSRRLTVDTAALTAKVDDKVSPRPVMPPIVKEPEPTPVVIEPPPPKKEVPMPTRPVMPPSTTPVVETPAPTPAKSDPNNGLWVALLVVLAVAGGGLVFFGVRRVRSRADDEEEPRKKKGAKKKVRAVEEEEE
jgi:hypothetical protein